MINVKSTIDENNSKLLVITVNEELFKKVWAVNFIKVLGLPKVFTDIDQVEKWFFNLERTVAKKIVLRLLAQRNYPSFLLVRKLQEKKISKETIFDVLEYIKKCGYINDNLWIKRKILQEFQKGYGPKMIFWKLKYVGLEEEVIHRYIDEVISRENILEKIGELCKKSKKSKEKTLSFLLRRGFDQYSIYEAMRN